MNCFIILSLLCLLSIMTVETAAMSPVTNLPAAFYDRPGLEDMPRIDYESMAVVNVLDYGAVGDGVTFVNEAFDRAVAALPPEGGVVYIPAGVYRFRPPSVSDRYYWRPQRDGRDLENVHFVGEGDKTVFLFEKNRSTGSLYGVHLGRATNVSLRNIRFEQRPILDSRWAPLLAVYPLAFGGAQKVQLINLIVDQGEIGIVFWRGSADLWVVDCQVRNTGADGIHFSNCVNVTAAYNYIENCGDDGIAAISTREGDDTRSINNRFLYNTVIGGKWGRGITLGGENCEVIGNWVEQMVMAGIFSQARGHGAEYGGGHPVENAAIIGNTVIRANLSERIDNALPGHRYGGAIKVSHEISNAQIVGNRVYGGQADGIRIGPDGIEAIDLLVADNELAGNLGVGLNVQASGGTFVRGLSLVDNQFSQNTAGALRISGSVRDVTFKDNEVYLEPVSGKLVDITSSGVMVPPDGIHLQAEASAYVDYYYEARTAPLDNQWAPVPTGGPRADLSVVNVRDYGAVGDGIADDTAAFLAAIAAMQDHSLLYIPPGTYSLYPVAGQDEVAYSQIKHHLLVQGYDDLHIVGEPGKTILLFHSPMHQGLRLLNVKNSSVTGLTLKLVDPPDYRMNRALLDISGCSHIRVERVHIQGASGPGLLLDSSDHLLVQECLIEDTRCSGISLLSCRQATVTGNVVENSGSHGIYLSWHGSISRFPQFTKISHNRVSGTKGGFGIAVASGDQIIVDNNHIEDTYQAGISLYQHHSLFWPKGMVVSNNTLERVGIGEFAITEGAITILRCRSGDFLIENNRLNTPQNGIWVSNSSLERLVIGENEYAVGREWLAYGELEQRDNIRQLILPWHIVFQSPIYVPTGQESSLEFRISGISLAELSLGARTVAGDVPVDVVSSDRFRVMIPPITGETRLTVVAAHPSGVIQRETITLLPAGGKIIPLEDHIRVQEGQSVTVRVRFITADGTLLTGEEIPRINVIDGWTIVPLRDEDGDGIAEATIPVVMQKGTRQINLSAQGFDSAVIRLTVE